MSGRVDPEVLAGLEVHLLPEQVELDEEGLLRDLLLLLDLRAHRLDPDRGQEDEHDGRHGADPVERHDPDREALLGRHAGARRGLGRHGLTLPALVPDREHRPAEERDQDEDHERDPRERVTSIRDVDDPEHEARCRQPEVAEDEDRPDLPALLLAHPAVAKPLGQEQEASSRGDHPCDQCSPLHRSPLFGFRLRRIRDGKPPPPKQRPGSARIEAQTPSARVVCAARAARPRWPRAHARGAG